MATVYNSVFLFKRGTKNRWREVNPILEQGEPGFEYDTGRLKIGDGVTAWLDLSYQDEQSIYNATTRSDFPSVGQEHIIYKAQEEQRIYQWNSKTSSYETIQSMGSLDDIEVISGGNAYI